MHDNTLSTDNRDKFIYLAGQYGQRVKFYNVEELCADKIAKMKEYLKEKQTTRYVIATMYRLLLSQILSINIEKVIYLDSDIIVNLDINELWRIELNDKLLAAVPEAFIGVETNKTIRMCLNGLVKAEDYFNAGVLLINLNLFRNEGDKITIGGIEFLSSNPQYNFFDQDILNYYFSRQTIKLPTKFNRFVLYARSENDLILRQRIYHYAGTPSELGLKFNMNDPFNRLWMEYFIKTPWFDEETIGRLYAGVQQIHVGLKQSMVNLSAIMSGKTRGFFAPPNNVDGLKKFFAIRNDEEIILAENQDSIKKLLDAMNASRGKKVFFIMIPFPFQILIQAGFVPGKDFVNGLEFFSEAQGVPLNSYPLVQAM